ncbi:hypothetical protein DPQ33_07350 [Oceanidesulfovibrio indonesiensis]|uniref:YhaN AAA domain-containing protein n=1 Tax=Oceanidesulfovibrio indonesiensis TaxID=54767 RepID=A0A7M3MFM8_9BACT|nr:YhaN family protein [Oceanidesulfovibrio indonesiensis]TVM17918.1 hypothetical protein DPQ33_07350 [Oceanidesulfovibrio indonesiensis]
MHIRRLDLRAFGPFTNKVLEFGDAGAGIHILYGPNEAGKSSAREALGDFFFGIPRQTDNDFLHPYKNMAIAAELALSSGSVITAARYKRDKNDLVDDANEPIDESWWRHTVLGGFERTFFSQMFAIGHETLREGTRGLLEGGGALGETLFAAASGIAHLRTVLDDLDKEREALFKKGGSKQPIAEISGLIRQLQKEEKELTARPDEYAEKQASLRALIRSRDETATQLEDVSAEVVRVQRRLSAVELSRKHRRILEELAAYADVRSLPEDFRERRKLAGSALQTAEDRVREAQGRRERLTQALEDIQVDTAVLAESTAIETLRMELSSHTKALQDSKALEQERSRIGFSVHELLKSLGVGLTPEDAAARRLPGAERNRITTLAEQRQALAAREEGACEALAEARANLTRAESELAAAEKPRDTTELAAGLELAGIHGDIDSRVAELGRRVADERRRIAESFASLGLRKADAAGSPSLDDLPGMPLPAADTVQRFDDEMTVAENALRREQDEVARIENELAAKRRELERVRRGGDLPTQAELNAARTLRDSSWELIRRRWLHGEPAEPEVRQLLDDLRTAGIVTPSTDDASEALADGFAAAMHNADAVADGLWQGARQLAVVMELESDAERLAEELKTAKSRLEDATAALQSLRSQWDDLWHPAGIRSGRPREMASILQRAISLRERLETLRDEETTHAGLKEERDRIRAMLTRGLEAVEALEVGAGQDRSAAALIALARRLMEEMAEKGRRRKALADKVAECKAAQASSEAKAGRAAEAIASWRKSWAAAVAPLCLGADASTEEVREYVDAIEAICTRQAEMADKERRIAAMREDHADYAARVRDVAGRAAPDLAEDTSAGTAIVELSRLHKEAADARAEKARLEKQLQDATAEHESATRAREQAEAQMTALVVEAGCGDAAELPDLEERSRRKIELERECVSLERELTVHAAGEELSRFIEDSLARDQDQLAARLEQAKEDQVRLLESRDEYLKQITLAEGELAAMQGESRAAEVRQRIAAEAAKLQTEVDRYVRLTVSAQVLRKEMERYRRDHQGPVLRAAGVYFRAMTRDSFIGLEADYDEKGDPVLAGVRPGGDRIAVPQMSDGSRDQLYLALRLGALDGYLKRNEPLPFIVDDVLVHFDDDRSAAAFSVLAEISRRTQVVFFTHHEHLTELARSAVPPELLSVQTL